VESIEKTRFVLHWCGVDLLKRFNSREKRAFDRTHIPPEPHGITSHVIAPAVVGKNQIHRNISLWLFTPRLAEQLPRMLPRAPLAACLPLVSMLALSGATNRFPERFADGFPRDS